MADRIIKGDSGNDVVIQNNAGSRKIEVTNSGDVEVTGDVKTTTVKATNLKANDGTAGLVVADSTGEVTSSGGIKATNIKTTNLKANDGTSSLEIADSTGDIGFSNNTDIKLKLPSAGGIFESDGSTQILTESGGSVTLNNVSFGSDIGDLPASKGGSFALVKSYQGFTVANSMLVKTDLFNSTYRDYRVIITGIADGTQSQLTFQFGSSGTLNTTSNYFYMVRGNDSNSAGIHTQNGHQATFCALTSGSQGANNFNRFVIDMLISNPQASGGTAYTGTSSNSRSSAFHISSFIGGYLDVDLQATDMGFAFNAGTGNRTLNIQSYGIKTS